MGPLKSVFSYIGYVILSTLAFILFLALTMFFTVFLVIDKINDYKQRNEKEIVVVPLEKENIN